MSNLVEIKNLNIRFSGERTVHAVNDLSLTLGAISVDGLNQSDTSDAAVLSQSRTIQPQARGGLFPVDSSGRSLSCRVLPFLKCVARGDLPSPQSGPPCMRGGRLAEFGRGSPFAPGGAGRRPSSAT